MQKKTKTSFIAMGLQSIFLNYTEPQQCLYFFPEPQGHFSFLPTFLLSDGISVCFSFFCSSFETTILRLSKNFITSFFIFSNNPSKRAKASFLNSDNGSFWPYDLKPITCLSCSKYCK